MHEAIWIIPLAPLVGAYINGKLAALYARRGRGPSEKLIAAIGVVAPLVSFVVACSVFLHFRGLEGAERMVIVDLFPWIVSGNLNIGFSLMIDSLSMLMVLVVTGIGTVIHIYSVGYMHGDRGFARYFAYLNLFMFSMLMLVMGKNLLILFVGWEGVGLCSYLLIGFWYKDLANAAAGKKAFIVNRIGDFAFLIGMFVLFVATSRMGEGTLDFVALRAMVSEHPQAFAATATAAGILLFIGACGKSAQIPLFVWLPDAMAGPTPVSALIHAATMVTAGVYMVTRLSFLYLQSDVAMAVVATVGAFTALFAATIGICQRDIKKVLAYSTISQLGYMFAALGVGAFSAGIFHLMTHAFFKACLFLGSGSVIHAMSGEQDMFKMGALGKKMKITALTFIIAAVAIAGVPPLAGFFSKDEILLYTFTSHLQPLGMVLWGLLFIGAGITAFYVFRAVFLTFFGERRYTDEVAHHVHESPLSMTIPLILLAVGSIFAGFLGVPGVLGGSNHLHHYLEPSIGLLAAHGDDVSHAVAAGHASQSAEVTLMVLSVLAGLLGIFVAYILYIRRPDRPAQLTMKLGRLYHLVYNKYFVDEAYDAMIVKPGYLISNRFLFNLVDVKIIDSIVNTIGVGTRLMGSLFRLLQTGVVRTYAFFFLIGILYVIYKMVG
ncbi:MAG: NADH-quinone oxidoreductase subunit L [bacterium]|nr:NADH-quinone oxidoreductase subunit L [bacterium]